MKKVDRCLEGDKKLVFPTIGWKVNGFTSRLVQDYMKEKDHQLGDTDSTN